MGKPILSGIEVRSVPGYRYSGETILHSVFPTAAAGEGVDLSWQKESEDSAKREVAGVPADPSDLYGDMKCWLRPARIRRSGGGLQVDLGSPIQIASELPTEIFDGEDLAAGYVPSDDDEEDSSGFSFSLDSTGTIAFTGGQRPYVFGFWGGTGRLGLPKGKVLTVRCQANPSFGYTVYVPKTAVAKAPTFVFMSPTGRARPVDIASAERFGWVMVGLTEARDGPWLTVDANRAAAIADLNSKLSIDMSRLYFGGFSGGARAAVEACYQFPGMVRGLVCIGASSLGLVINGRFSNWIFPNTIPVALIAGSRDYNLDEVSEYANRATTEGRQCLFLTFDGGHQMPPTGVLHRALVWLAAAK